MIYLVGQKTRQGNSSRTSAGRAGGCPSAAAGAPRTGSWAQKTADRGRTTSAPVWKSSLPTQTFGVIAAIVLLAFAEPIVSLFGTDAEMVNLASTALRLNAVLFVTFGFQMVYASLYLSIGKSLVGGLLSLSRQRVFFLPLIYALPRLFQLSGVIWVQPAADLLTTAVTSIFAIKITHALTVKTSESSQGGEST